MSELIMVNRNLFSSSLNCLSAYHAKLRQYRKDAETAKAVNLLPSIDAQLFTIEQIVTGLMHSAEVVYPPSTN